MAERRAGDVLVAVRVAAFAQRCDRGVEVAGSAAREDAGMTVAPSEHRFYTDLAAWWPLISPPEEYADEAAFAATVLGSASIPVRDVLELGSGGGHNAVHLKARFAMTLVDLSEDMLTVSRRLNPECPHHRGDMRTVRLGRTFDAVFVHDAVDYMTSEADLGQAVETAFVHCRPGGVAVFVPDHTAESFEPSSEHGGGDDVDGRGVRYLAWTWDPDPGDAWVLTEYAFLLREADGAVHAVHETHRTGLFGRDVWLRLLVDTGFDPSAVTEQTTEDRTPRELFVGRRPPG
jgi:SAM-dependent methyltransferase